MTQQTTINFQTTTPEVEITAGSTTKVGQTVVSLETLQQTTENVPTATQEGHLPTGKQKSNYTQKTNKPILTDKVRLESIETTQTKTANFQSFTVGFQTTANVQTPHEAKG